MFDIRLPPVALIDLERHFGKTETVERRPERNNYVQKCPVCGNVHLKFLKRLDNGGNVIVAEGYIFEFERKGYLTAGSFVPEVTLEHPELVRQMYQEFVHAGSDVVLAFTYYAHREKLRLVGREDDLVSMNTAALKMAREVADESGCLMAGNICNTSVYDPHDETTWSTTEQMFKEQIELAVQERADYIVGETFVEYGEAKIALDSIKKYGQGLPSVITFSAPPDEMLLDGVGVVEACRRLEEAGSDVVGLNCGRGPETMLPLLRQIKQACKGPIAAVPVPYRTTEKEAHFMALTVPNTGEPAFPLDLLTCLCSRGQIADFATQCRQIGVQYVGLCCGNSANLTRIVAETYGRTPPASRYAPQMDKHYIFGDKSKFKAVFTENLKGHMTGKGNA